MLQNLVNNLPYHFSGRTGNSVDVDAIGVDVMLDVVKELDNNVKHYIYTNVNIDIVTDYLFDHTGSAGKFVNEIRKSGAQYATF